MNRLTVTEYLRVNQKEWSATLHYGGDRQQGITKKIRDERLRFVNIVIAGFAILTLTGSAGAQIVTIGAGGLVSKHPAEVVYELHGETPPFFNSRAYITLSWTRESAKPAVISAAEYPVLHYGDGFTGLGAGLLWLEVNDYQPYTMLVSTTVIPLPVPRTSFVMIGSVLPFEKFDWSVVFKIGFTLFFIR